MDTAEEILNGLLQELRRGTIVMGVLSQLEEPRYGYSLVQRLNEAGMPTEAGTLYPVSYTHLDVYKRQHIGYATCFYSAKDTRQESKVITMIKY